MTIFSAFFPSCAAPGSGPKQGDVACPQFYGEADLPRLAVGPARPESAASNLGALLAVDGDVARGALVRGMLQVLGFDWLGHGLVTVAQGRMQPLRIFTTYAHPDWITRYFVARHHDVDPRCERATASGLPVVWDTALLADLFAADPATGEVAAHRQRFLDDLRGSGVGSGVMFRVASATDVNEQTLISLSSRTPGRAWITDGIAGQALMLGLSVHEYLAHRARPQAAASAERAGDAPMSTTQRDILGQLVDGRSDKEIAYRLQLSLHAVDYHMRQLRRRFHARNRVQLLNAVTQAH